MKITFISNACAIYEHDGFRLLADPWLVPGAFGTWTHDPPLRTTPEDVKDVDALYISHIHPDHCCPETLKVFRRDIPIVTLQDKLSLCAKHLERMGFTNVQAIMDGVSTFVGPFTVTMFGPFAKHPFHAGDCEIGNVVDSALLIWVGGKKVLNCNDNTMTIAAAEAFRLEYGEVDLAQLNFNNAGPYPACFSNLSHDEKLAEAERCVARNLRHMADVGRALGAKRVQPFAGAYKLGYGKEHLNQYLGTTTAEVAAGFLVADAIAGSSVSPVLLGEGESIDLGS